MMKIGNIKITHRAACRLIFWLKLTPFDTLTVRSIATQAFNQPSKYKQSLRTGPTNTQSVRRIDERTIEYCWIRTTNQNFSVNIVIVRREVIEDASKYIPQSTFLNSLFRNVIKEKIPLMKPITNIIIVSPGAIWIKTDCFRNDIFDWILFRKISLIVKPR